MYCFCRFCDKLWKYFFESEKVQAIFVQKPKQMIKMELAEFYAIFIIYCEIILWAGKLKKTASIVIYKPKCNEFTQ